MQRARLNKNTPWSRLCSRPCLTLYRQLTIASFPVTVNQYCSFSLIEYQANADIKSNA